MFSTNGSLVITISNICGVSAPLALVGESTIGLLET